MNEGLSPKSPEVKLVSDILFSPEEESESKEACRKTLPLVPLSNVFTSVRAGQVESQVHTRSNLKKTTSMSFIFASSGSVVNSVPPRRLAAASAKQSANERLPPRWHFSFPARRHNSLSVSKIERRSLHHSTIFATSSPIFSHVL